MSVLEVILHKYIDFGCYWIFVISLVILKKSHAMKIISLMEKASN